jgi:hypothetical protein
MKDIECSDLISTRYNSEIDGALVSNLDSCPPFASCAFAVLHLSGALANHSSNMVSPTINKVNAILALHGLIFCFIYDDTQRMILHSFIIYSLRRGETLLLDFLSNPRRSQHHAVDNKMHNSTTERCFSYIINHPLAHFSGIPSWSSKSKNKPWPWSWQESTNGLNEFRWRWQKEHPGRDKMAVEALILALKYLPYLLNKATRSGEIISLAKMWTLRYPRLVSLFPQHTKKAGKAVKRYLARFDIDGKEQCESEVAVGPPPLCIV